MAKFNKKKTAILTENNDILLTYMFSNSSSGNLIYVNIMDSATRTFKIKTYIIKSHIKITSKLTKI